MDIFFVTPKNKNRILFLYEWKNKIFQGETLISSFQDSKKIDLISFPLNSDYQLTQKDLLFITTHLSNFIYIFQDRFKLGTYFKKTPNLYKYVLKNASFTDKNSEITAYFDIYDTPYVFKGMKLVKKGKEYFFLPKQDSYLHYGGDCGCAFIKEENDIQINSCLFCLEHEDLLLEWLADEYKKQMTEGNKPQTNIILFPKKNKNL